MGLWGRTAAAAGGLAGGRVPRQRCRWAAISKAHPLDAPTSAAGAAGMSDRPYTPRDLAARWCCPERHIRAMIHRGELVCFRAGKLLRISAAEVRRVECGSNCTGGDGMPSGPKTAEPAAPASAPRIVVLPSVR